MWLRYLRTISLSSMLFVASCATEGGFFDKTKYDQFDRDLSLTRDDYEHMAAPAEKTQGEEPELELTAPLAPPVPEIAQMLAAPRPPQIGEAKLVSVAVTDDVPLKDVLLELARLADVDIELDAGIAGGISFIANDKPFNEVIERISDLAGLRYTMKNDVLRVERDVPYIQNYSIDFLNVVRNSESEVSIATDVLSSSGGGEGDSGGSGLTTGTTSTISSSTESDFWESLESGLTEILNYVPQQRVSSGDTDDIFGAGFSPVGAGTAATTTTATDSASSGDGSSGTGSGSGSGAEGAFYVVNRQAGILSVSASQRQHGLIEQYLGLLERSVSAQVLIEAKIVEVVLDKDFNTGVNWTSVLGNSDFEFSFPNTFTDFASFSILGPGVDTDGVGAENTTGDNNLGVELDAVVQLAESFGTIRTLASPRLHAVNNQQAVFTFARNQVFFQVDVEQEDDVIVDGAVIEGAITFTTERQSVPVGIILSILPSINLETNEVTLSVRPTLSRQVAEVTDPGSALVNSTLPEDQRFINQIPVVEVRELDSVMKIKSGAVMVIGGLMQDVVDIRETGLPGVSDIPWLGNAFKSNSEEIDKTELVIFIKASIVSPRGNYDPADKMIYEKFTDDPRPLAF